MQQSHGLFAIAKLLVSILKCIFTVDRSLNPHNPCLLFGTPLLFCGCLLSRQLSWMLLCEGGRAFITIIWRQSIQGGEVGSVDWETLASCRQETARRLPVHWGRGSYCIWLWNMRTDGKFLYLCTSHRCHKCRTWMVHAFIEQCRHLVVLDSRPWHNILRPNKSKPLSRWVCL